MAGDCCSVVGDILSAAAEKALSSSDEATHSGNPSDFPPSWCSEYFSATGILIVGLSCPLESSKCSPLSLPFGCEMIEIALDNKPLR